MTRERTLVHSIVVRIDDDLLAALEQDADENGRTVSQSIRLYLRAALEVEA